MARHHPIVKPAMRSLFLGCAFAAFFAAPVSAEELKAADNENASKNLNQILQDAERRGVLSSNDKVQNSSNDSAQSPPVITAALPASCDHSHILDFSDLKETSTYHGAIETSAHTDDNIKAARTLMSLGMGLEAYNLLLKDRDPDAELLRPLARLLDRHKLGPQASQLQGLKVCDNPSLIWGTLATPAAQLETFGQEDIRAILQTLSAYPPYLREIITVRLGILSAESGQVAVARRFWLSLNDFTRQYERTAPDDVMSDYSYLYFKALIAEADTPDKAIGLYTYILQRDTLYRPAAIKRVQVLYQQSGTPLPKAIEAELVALGHQYSGQEESREANFDLIGYQARTGELDSAMVATKANFSPHDPEYGRAVNIIAGKLNEKLSATPLPTRVSGLNTYLSDPQFFKTAKLVSTLKYKALRTALDADLPELWQHIYDTDPTDSHGLALIIEARTMLGIKAGDLDGLEGRDTTATLMHKIEHHIRNAEIGSAKTLIEALPEDDRKADYELQIAWLEGRWNDITESEAMAPPNGDTSQAAQKSLAPAAKDLAKLLAKPSPKNNGKASINTIEDAEALLKKINDELKTAREYIDNG